MVIAIGHDRTGGSTTRGLRAAYYDSLERRGKLEAAYAGRQGEKRFYKDLRVGIYLYTPDVFTVDYDRKVRYGEQKGPERITQRSHTPVGSIEAIPVGHSGKQFDNYQVPAQDFASLDFLAVLFDPPGQPSERTRGNDHFRDGVRSCLTTFILVRNLGMLESLGFHKGDWVVGMDFPTATWKSHYYQEHIFGLVVASTLEMLISQGYKAIVIVNGHGAWNQLETLERLAQHYSHTTDTVVVWKLAVVCSRSRKRTSRVTRTCSRPPSCSIWRRRSSTDRRSSTSPSSPPPIRPDPLSRFLGGGRVRFQRLP